MARLPAAEPPADPAPPAGTDLRANLRDRLAISILLVPLVVLLAEAGGLVYLLGVLVMFALAAWEYVRLFRAGRQRPALPLVLAGVLLFIGAEQFPALNPSGALLAVLILAPLTWHLVDYERGTATAGIDFAVTVGGIFYLGGLGRYFVALRSLPDGLWWLLAALTSMWMADTGAYAVGRLLGRHRMAPRLSPKKTWEGYVGSVVAGAVFGGLLSAFWSLGASSASLLNWQSGAVLGVLVGALGPIGDLGVSMLKRQIGVKDTGNLLAGHGGALDRIDSWLVAVTIGYYFVLLLPRLMGG